MNEIRDGGPAFPMPIAGGNDGGVYNTLEQSAGELGGMSLRDYFAGQALAGFLAWGAPVDDSVGREAYIAADAMLQARGEA